LNMSVLTNNRRKLVTHVRQASKAKPFINKFIITKTPDRPWNDLSFNRVP
jgi:hypothetical protein